MDDRQRGGAEHIVLLQLEMTSKGVISEISGRLPAMKMTEPYSPTARAKASAKPVSNAGKMAGKITLVKSPPARRAERRCGFFNLGFNILDHRLQGAHDKRQGDESQRG